MPQGELGERLGSGKVAEVFASGPNVVKLYRAQNHRAAAFREAATLSVLADRDLPVPHVFSVRLYGDRWGVEMSRVAGPSFAEQMRATENLAPWLAAMADLQALVHDRPGRYMPSQRQRLVADISATPLLAEALRQKLLAALAELPEGDRLCHGDYHPYNLLGSLAQPVLVDWLDAGSGSPAADACRSYVLILAFDPDLARLYIETYAERSGMALAEIRLWLPFIAAARLAEGVADENPHLLELAAAF